MDKLEVRFKGYIYYLIILQSLNLGWGCIIGIGGKEIKEMIIYFYIFILIIIIQIFCWMGVIIKKVEVLYRLIIFILIIGKDFDFVVIMGIVGIGSKKYCWIRIILIYISNLQ